MLATVSVAAETNAPVLITGERGAGKEAVARQLHLKSARANKNFVRANCAAFSDEFVSAAAGGTLFLGEVAHLPPKSQQKILDIQKSDVRVVASTSRGLESLVQSGQFMAALYRKLNIVPIHVLPLRARKDDIEPLADFFLRKYGEKTKKCFDGFSEDAKKILFEYSWPGNVRELKNAVERACINGIPPYVVAADFFAFAGGLANQNTLGEHTRHTKLKSALNEFKRNHIVHVLEKNGWNQTKAAKVLGIQRTYLSRLLNELGIRER